MGRATATVLFTDLVGSTELRGRLGEEAAEELRRRHDRLLTEAVEAHSGRVVKGLGDGIMATFAGAADAVAAAVAIQQAIDRLNRSGKAAVPLAVRVGLSGDASFEDDDVHGTPVIEASRLCSAAGAGEILAADVVRVLAGSSGGHDFGSVGLPELKGLHDPVPAVRVGWEPVAVSTIPLPALLTDVGRIFVGRDGELERLSQLWKEAAAGERRVALLAGEPGVGKTRLAAELAEAAHSEGAVVLAGRCDEDLGVPYQPFVEALRHFADHIPTEELAGRLGRYGGDLVRLVPELNGRVPNLPPLLQSDPETERYRLFDAVAAWLAASAAEQPVLVVLDDLQWAAKPTLLLLRHVVHSPGLERVLVVGTYRDTELGHDHPLLGVLADLRRQEGVERVSLTGLDAAGVAAHMEQAAGHTMDDQDLLLARAIHAETEGNPFFVREVLRHLAEIGAIEQRHGRWTTRLPLEELGIPEGVREVVGKRLSRLSPNANRVLRVAAVVGPQFELSVLQSADALNEDDLVIALEEATEARLVVEVADRYRFAHALVRDSLYHGLSSARRVTLHRRVAQAIEAVHAATLDDHVSGLAYHYARASAPTAATEKAVTYAIRAGDRALAQLAHDEAATYYRQALELVTAPEGPIDDGQRLEILILVGEAERRAGDPAYRQTLLAAADLARQRGDANALTRAALANSRVLLYTAIGEIDLERVAVLESAINAVGTEDTPTRARLLAHLGLELVWGDERDRRVQLSDQAVGVARRLADPATLSDVLLARFYTIAAPATLPERLADTFDLLAVAKQLGDHVTTSRGLALRLRAATEAGDVAEARRCLAANERLAAELGQPALRWVVAVHKSGLALLTGHIEEAEAVAATTLELGDAAGQPDARIQSQVLHFQIRFEQGRMDEVAETFRETVHYLRMPSGRAMLALLWSELDRLTDARQIFDELAASDFDLPLDMVWLRGMTDCATVATRLGDHSRAATLYDRLIPYADQFPTVAYGGVMSGSTSHHLGVVDAALGRFGEAQSRFATAEAIHERIGAPTWLARTRLEWARMLLDRQQAGDTDRARELLGQALATARQLGLANVERRAVALIRELE